MAIFKKIIILLACLFVGILWGLFSYSYFLVDLFPITSHRLIVAVVMVIFTSSFFHYYTFVKLLFPFWNAITNKQRFFSLLGTLILGIWSFMSTSPWDKQIRYLLPLLPVHHLELLIEGKEQESTQVLLCCFVTSLGEVSFSGINYNGWQRVDKHNLKLTSWNKNILIWQGKTGENLHLQFKVVGDSHASELTLLLKWEDREERFKLTGEKFDYKRHFDVPWFANRTALFTLGILLFTVLFMPLCVASWHPEWHKRMESHLIQQKSFSRKEIEWLLGIWLFSLILRSFNLECLPPYADEYFHLLAAKNLLIGKPISEVYQRSLWITTIPVFLSFRLFGPAIWSARLPGVIVNSLAIFPLYFLMRRVNVWVAISSVLLFATSPWMVATSRYVREYAYHPFYFYLIVGFALVLFEKSMKKEWKKMHIFYGCLALGMPIVYGIFIDKDSTFKVLLIAYAVFTIFLIWKAFDFLYRRHRRFLYLSFPVILALIGFVWSNSPAFTRLFTALLGKHLTPLAPDYLHRLDFFLLPSAQQWYFERTTLFVAPMWMAALWFSFIARRHTPIPLQISVLFSSYLIILALWVATPLPRPRYLTYAQIWYIPFLALGAYSSWHYANTFLKQKQALLSAFLVGLLSINPVHVMHPLFCEQLKLYATSKKIYITEENKYEVSSAHRFLTKHVKTGDALVAVEYAAYAKFVGEPVFGSVLMYRGKSFQDLIEFAKHYPSGWIVLDASRVSKEFPRDQSIIEDISIQYMGQFDDLFIWKWEKIR